MVHRPVDPDNCLILQVTVLNAFVQSIKGHISL